MTTPSVAATIATVRESLATQLPSPSHPSARQPRDQGKFSGPVYGADPEPAVADPAPIVEGAPVEEGASGEDAPVEGEPSGEAAETSEGADEGEETPATIAVEMTDRNGKKMVIEAADEATADLLRMHQNAYQRRDQLDTERTNFQRHRGEFEAEREQFQLDPVQSLAAAMDNDPAEMGAIILTMLALRPEVLTQVFPEIEQWQTDPMLQRARTAEIAAAYGERKGQIKQQIDERRVASRYVRDVEGIARSLIPPSIKPEYHDQFVDDCVRDVFRACERSGQKFVHPDQVPDVLRHRLAYAGLREDDIDAAIARLRPHEKSRPTGKPVVAKPTGPQLVKAAATVKQAAAAPSGAGGQRAGVQLPPKLGVKDTVKALRQSQAFRG